MHCENFRHSLEGYLAEGLSETDRLEFREHLSGCASCRSLALSEDPTLMLAAVPRRSPPPERVDECVAAVSALIHQDRLMGRLRSPRSGWLAAAAAVVIAVGAAASWRLATPGPPVPAQPVVEAANAEEVSPRVPPRVEVDMGEGVRVYQFAEQEDENTAVYFIVNAALES